mmetsp:Transcript_29127/g.46175  ORF Transcript_29127/g.46175 Transcript_29127/m.46175 type:complete len:201 (-) Transcript_29127:1033-1635(-)
MHQRHRQVIPHRICRSIQFQRRQIRLTCFFVHILIRKRDTQITQSPHIVWLQLQRLGIRLNRIFTFPSIRLRGTQLIPQRRILWLGLNCLLKVLLRNLKLRSYIVQHTQHSVQIDIHLIDTHCSIEHMHHFLMLQLGPIPSTQHSTHILRLLFALSFIRQHAVIRVVRNPLLQIIQRTKWIDLICIRHAKLQQRIQVIWI